MTYPTFLAPFNPPYPWPMTAQVWLDATSGNRWHPISEQVLAGALRLGWAHPSGYHSPAAATRSLIDTSLSSLAQSWGVSPSHIVAVHQLSRAFDLVAANVPATASLGVQATCRLRLLKALPENAVQLSVDETGQLLSSTQSLDVVVINSANQETGVLTSVAHARELFPHSLVISDDTESVGRFLDSSQADISIVRASAWQGPLSVCFVIFRHAQPNLTSAQRQMLAPDPVLLAVAAAAWEMRVHRHELDTRLTEKLTTHLSAITGVTLHGQAQQRAPHMVCFSVAGIDGEALAQELDKRGVYVGSGSACLQDNRSASHVLEAMGNPDASTVRIDLGHSVEDSEMEFAAVQIAEAINSLRG